MRKRFLSAVAILTLVAGCSSIQTSMGRLTVKDYTSKSGKRVMAGQAEPKSDYSCKKLAQEREDWGLTGNMDKAASIQRVTAVAVDRAPGKGANYAFIIVPAETRVMGFNTNAFRDAQVAYYKCEKLP